MKFTQYRICFINSGVNLFVLPSITHEQNLKELELFVFLQYIATYLNGKLTWFSGGTKYVSVSVLSFIPAWSLITRSCIPKKCMLKACSKDAISSKLFAAIANLAATSSLSNSFRLNYESTSDSTNLYQSLKPVMSGFHLMLLIWTQTSHQEYNDLMASSRWPSTSYSW